MNDVHIGGELHGAQLTWSPATYFFSSADRDNQQQVYVMGMQWVRSKALLRGAVAE